LNISVARRISLQRYFLQFPCEPLARGCLLDFSQIVLASASISDSMFTHRGAAMPCYLFSYHAYASWLPDRQRGYVRRGQGILPPDREMAEHYRQNMTQDVVRFDDAVQRHMVEELLAASEHQQMRCHYVSTEPTHVHVLVSWTINRKWEVVRAKLRESVTRRLNREVRRQEWFSKSPSRKRVKDRGHFDYLMTEYLRKHSGWKWRETHGFFR
jgi:hypothetical protein